MTHNANELHRAVRHAQPMFNIKSRSVSRCSIEPVRAKCSILLMCSLQYGFQCRLVRWVALKNSKSFVGPDDVPGGNDPSEAPGVARPLCCCQIGLTSRQCLLDTPTVQYFSGQLAVDLGQFSGAFQDTLFKLLIQTLNLSLRRLVPGGFDNIPGPTPTGDRKLMCSHHIKDFSGSARRERVSTEDSKTLIRDGLIE